MIRVDFNEQTPLPSTTRYARVCFAIPQGGEAKTLIKQIIDMKIQNPHQPRKETNSIPSPLGEGQTDVPIAQANQGEVQRIRRSIVTIGVR